MKKILIPIVAVALIFTSCDELGSLIPDVDKVITQNYDILIEDNTPTGATQKTFIDITEYDEYKTYSDYLDGYLINKMTYEVLNYDAPEDLYFSGTIEVFGEDSTDIYELGTIASVNLADIAALAEENEVLVDSAVAEQLIMWLEEAGTFNIQFGYEFEDAEGESYVFTEEDFGSSFQLNTNVYMTILTGAGSFEPTTE